MGLNDNNQIETVTSVLDHILTNQEAKELVTRIHVFEDRALGGSDHRPLVCEFEIDSNIPPPLSSGNGIKAAWSRKALKDPIKCENYAQALFDTQDELKELIYPIPTNPYCGTRENIDFLDNAFVEWIRQALHNAKIPFIERVPKKKRSSRDYLSPELVQLDHLIGEAELNGQDTTSLKKKLLKGKLEEQRDKLQSDYRDFLSELEPLEMLKFTKSLKEKVKSDFSCRFHNPQPINWQVYFRPIVQTSYLKSNNLYHFVVL